MLLHSHQLTSSFNPFVQYIILPMRLYAACNIKNSFLYETHEKYTTHTYAHDEVQLQQPETERIMNSYCNIAKMKRNSCSSDAVY